MSCVCKSAWLQRKRMFKFIIYLKFNETSLNWYKNATTIDLKSPSSQFRNNKNWGKDQVSFICYNYDSFCSNIIIFSVSENEVSHDLGYSKNGQNNPGGQQRNHLGVNTSVQCVTELYYTDSSNLPNITCVKFFDNSHCEINSVISLADILPPKQSQNVRHNTNINPPFTKS